MQGVIRHSSIGMTLAVISCLAMVMCSAVVSSAQGRLNGQVVGGGGRSSSATQSVVGGISQGAGGASSGGGFRIASGSIHYGRALSASYSGTSVEVVDAVNRTLSVAVQGGSGTIVGRFFSRLGGQSSYTQSAMTLVDGDSLIYGLSASQLGIRGLEYYFEIERSQNTAQIGSSVEPLIFKVRIQNASGSPLPANQYRMVGFPFDVSPTPPSQVFEDDLGTYDPEVWRSGRFNSQSGDYDEYPNVGAIARGKGYWLIVRDAGNVGASGQSTIPDTTDAAGSGLRYGRIVVLPGWNQIATPFAFDIDWNDRIVETGIDPVLWAYTSGFDAVTSYEAAETLEPFTGYWLHNSAAGSRQLLLPYVESAGGVNARRNKGASEQDWRINLSITAGTVGDRCNVAGAAPGAEIGADGNDFAEPPVIGTYVSLAFLRESVAETNAFLAGDFRSRTESFHTFEILVRGNVTDEGRLTASFDGEWPPESRVVMIDPISNQAFDLQETPEIVLPQPLSEEGARYKLIVGNENNPAFPDRTTTTIPRSFVLAQNYPNPFNASTAIDFEVASAGTVKITVFDVLGRTVRILTQHEYGPGLYTVEWDGNDGDGLAVASGIYVYQLAAGGVRISRKMMVLK